MATLVLKGVSDKLHRELKARAQEHRRSVTQEAIGILDQAVRKVKINFPMAPRKLKKPLTLEEVLWAHEAGQK